MGFLCLIIIIWALADGSLSSLLFVLGGLILLSLLGSNVFLIIIIVLVIMFFCLVLSSNEDEKQKVNNDTDEINKIEDKNNIQLDSPASQETNKKQEFNAYLSSINNKNPDDSDYSHILFHLGKLYEELYQDYFRSACYVYLSTVYNSKNKIYEDEYIHLCKKLNERKGSIWEYYVTLVKNPDDIEKYADELLQNEKEYNSPNVSKNTNKQTVSKQPIYKNNTIVGSKFEEFNPESYLHSLGYKVGKTGLSSSKRRTLLKKAIESGKISKYDVIETLERNISLFQNRENRQQAVNDWWEDLYYVKTNF